MESQLIEGELQKIWPERRERRSAKNEQSGRPSHSLLAESNPIPLEPELLPIQLDSELKLPRIVSRCSLASIAERTAAQRTHCGHVVAVRNVEDIGNQVHVETLAKINALRNANIVKESPRLRPSVTAQVAIEGKQRHMWEIGLRCGRGRENLIANFLQSPTRRIPALERSSTDRIDSSVRTHG